MDDSKMGQGPLPICSPFILPTQQQHSQKRPLDSVPRCPPRVRLNVRVLQPRLPVDGSNELAVHPLRQHHVERQRDGGFILRHFRLRIGLQPPAGDIQAGRGAPTQLPRILDLPAVHQAVREHCARDPDCIRAAPAEPLRRHVGPHTLRGLILRPAHRCLS